MCGIAGIAGLPTADSIQAVRDMNAHLARRGPDSEGLLRTGAAVLGHRRLAIFDLSEAGNQPMTTVDGRIAVVFNGAIYNFRELRAELAASGVTFRSQTDTEVLLEGYRAWGIDRLVSRSRGMFAFALWDADSETLYLVRDRLGVKPLVYADQGGAIAFASTVRALRPSGMVGAVDPRAVAEFLEHGYVPESSAIYEGAAKLPPASIAEWRSGERLRIRRYWRPPRAEPAGTVPFSEAVERTEQLLREAVRLRLFADVPVGCLLSAGIDSALICWAAAAEGADVRAFTIGIPGHASDESAGALATAREIGIDVEVLPMSGDDAPNLDDLTNAYAEPFATQSALGMLRISRAIRSAGIKVVLTGDGGDDVFLGYERHLQMQLVGRVARYLPSSAPALWKAVRPALPAAGTLRRARHFVDYLTGGLGAYLKAHDGLPEFREAGLLGSRLLDILPRSRQLPESRSSATRLLSEYLEHDLEHQFVGEYMTKVDGATMSQGLEARAPYLDHVLWEYAASLPFATRLRRRQLKAVLRAVAARRVSPRLAAGAKRGFSVPVESWIRGRWLAELTERLVDGPLCRDGWVSSHGLQRALSVSRSDGLGAHHLWYLAVLDSWLRHDAEVRVGLQATVVTPSLNAGG